MRQRVADRCDARNDAVRREFYLERAREMRARFPADEYLADLSGVLIEIRFQIGVGFFCGDSRALDVEERLYVCVSCALLYSFFRAPQRCATRLTVV